MMLRFSVVILLLVLSCAAQAEVYKWVDADGKTHFGDKVPESAKVETINLPTSPRGGQPDVKAQELKERQQMLLDAIDENRSLKQKKTQEYAEKRAQLNQHCVKLRDYLKNISAGRTYVLDKKGERIYDNDAEHDKEIQQTEREIKKYCR